MERPAWQTWISGQAVLSHATGVSARVIIGYAAITMGAGPTELGLVAASFAIPSLVGAYPLGRFADIAGGARAILIGTLINLGGLIGSFWADSLLLLLACCCALGVGHVACLIGQQTLVAHRVADAHADSAFGNLTAASSVGQLVGPLVAAASLSAANGIEAGIRIGLASSIVMTILATGLSLLLLRDHRRGDRTGATDERDQRTPPWAVLWRSLLVSGIVLAAVDLMYTFMPLWGEEHGYSPAIVGALLSTRAVASIVSRIGLGRLTARFGRKLVLTVPLLAGGIAFAALPWLPVWGAVAVMLVIGIALGVPQPLTVTWLITGITRSARGRLLGWRLTSNRFAQSTLPVVVGVASADAGSTAVFSAIAILLAASALVSATS